MTPKSMKNRTCVIIASGPSLRQQDVNLIAKHKDQITTVVINDAYRLAPWADVLFSSDAAWISHHGGNIAHLKFEKITLESEPGSKADRQARRYGFKAIPFKWGSGLNLGSNAVHAGHCSGFAAFNHAVNQGFDPICLIGFDCMAEDNARLHFFGNHPKPLRNGLPFKKIVAEFEKAATQIEARGEPAVFNFTRKTALTCFDQMDLEDGF